MNRNDYDYLNNIIYKKRGSIPDILCDEIIKKFDNDADKHRDGIIFRGIDKTIKDTKDMLIPKKNNNWRDIENFLYTELSRNLKIYLKKLNFDNGYYLDPNKDSYLLTIDDFMIQRYEKNIGKYEYHNDSLIQYNRERVITFLWYLNDINDGGETEFFGNYRIKPEKGKLIFFPASWCFPHCGLIPKSSDKYIITGWFYKTNI